MVGAAYESTGRTAAVGLAEAVQQELAFLRQVHCHADILYDPDVIKLACSRYEYIWLPLLRAKTKAVPPVDIAFVWHCHLLSPASYAAACGVPVESAPEFVYPDPVPTPAVTTDPQLRLSLTSRTAAITSMRQSILAWIGTLPSPRGSAGSNRGSTLPPLLHAEEVAAATERHKWFYYQVSLPHYRDPSFQDAAVGRYKTFLSLHKSHPNTALQPPCDIELVRRAHMCMPASQRGFPDPPPPPQPASPGTSPAWRRSASNGSHRRPASDGRPLTARSWVADHGEHDEATRAAFSNAGWELFRSGAMFRGTPRRLTPRQREECQPVAPSSGVKVSIARCEWHADGPGGSSAPASAAAAPATITGWKLAKASLLGGTPTVAFTPGGSPVVLRHRELTSLNLSVQLSEMRPEGSKKTVTVTSKAKICPMALMQAGEHTVPVRMPVKLKYAMARNWVAVVVLQLAAAHDVVSCGFPVAAGGASPWQHVRSAPSSRAEVSEPLLLPLSAVSDSGPDVAEVAVCAVNGPDSTAAFRGPPMQVKITSSTKHLAMVAEVFPAAADASGSVIPSVASHTFDGLAAGTCATPAATAHSVNLDHLPAAADLGGAPAVALDPTAAERAFVLRSGGEDWGIVIGQWKGQKLADPVQQTPSDHGYLAWRLIVLKDPRMSDPDPASRGYASVVRMTSRAKRSHDLVFCGDSGWASLVCSASTGQFRLEFTENSNGPSTAREAGRLSAILAALATAIGLLQIACMPCTRSVSHPENPLQTLHEVTADSRGFVGSWENVPHCRPLTALSFVPTNGYVCKRLYTDRAVMGRKEHPPMLSWFGSDSEMTCAKISRVLWGGRLADEAVVAELRAAWSAAPPSRKSSAALSAQSVPASDMVPAVGPPMRRLGSALTSTGSLI